MNGLSSTQYPDTVVDQHLKEAFNEVEDALKITIATTAQAMSAVEFNSKDLFFTKNNTMILYLGDFVHSAHYMPLRTVTLVETRTNEDNDYTTETEGSNDDYTVDLKTNSIRFNWRLSPISGYENVRITGTYGVVASPMTSLEEKYKKYIALLAAIKGLRYAVGGGYNESKSMDVGQISTRKEEFSSTSSATYERLQDALKDHLKAYGLTQRRTIMKLG